jgi:hypothetical protein
LDERPEQAFPILFPDSRTGILDFEQQLVKGVLTKT